MDKSIDELQTEMDRLECFVCDKRFKTKGRWRRHLAQTHHVDTDGNDLTGDALMSALTPKRLRKKTMTSSQARPVSPIVLSSDHEFITLDEASDNSSDIELELLPDEIVPDEDEAIQEDQPVEVKEEEQVKSQETEKKVEDEACVRKKTRPTPLSKILPKFRLSQPRVHQITTQDYKPRARRNLITREALTRELETGGHGTISLVVERLTQRHQWTPNERDRYFTRLADIRRGRIAAAAEIRLLIPTIPTEESLRKFLEEVDGATRRIISAPLPEDE